MARLRIAFRIAFRFDALNRSHYYSAMLKHQFPVRNQTTQ